MLIVSGYMERQTNQSDLHPSIERLMYDQPLTKRRNASFFSRHNIMESSTECMNYPCTLHTSGMLWLQLSKVTRQTPTAEEDMTARCGPEPLRPRHCRFSRAKTKTSTRRVLFKIHKSILYRTNGSSSAQLTHYLHPHGFTILFVRAKKETLTCRSRSG